MIFVIDDNDRCQGTRAQTVDSLEREFIVIGGATGLDLQPFLESAKHGRSPADMAGRTQADRAEMLTAWLEAKCCVERDDTVDMTEGQF